MLTWIAQTTILSIVLIVLLHHLINFFKSTLTVPKIKDLVNSPKQKYENIYNIISNTKNVTFNEEPEQTTQLVKDYTLIDLLPKLEPPQNMQHTQNMQNTQNPQNMKNELKNFLKTQLNDDNSSSQEITQLDSFSDSSKYSIY